MHRIHHSVDASDYNSNFSVTLSCWDRILRTYRADPAAGEAGLAFGIEPRDAGRDQELVPLLFDPFLPRGARGTG
jgi:sterol desaturase/sphingolipid hydroxylase (fatty acid hydroxylase superfamily)